MILINVVALFLMLLFYERLAVSSLEINISEISVPESEIIEGGVLRGIAPVNDRLLTMSTPEGLKLYFPSTLLPAFPEDLEVSDYCRELLHIFAERYVSYVNCLVSSARPVKVCQNCYINFSDLEKIYTNISSDQVGPGNVSCRDSLLRSDRLMLVFMLYEKLQDIWEIAGCSRCLSKDPYGLSNDTVYYMTMLNESLSCFDKQQSNHSELCKDCKADYKGLNELYSKMEKNYTLCIDIEDAMNMTRRLWSKNFNCSFPREETVPVIAVSSFMLFLPIIFYLSSFLHSEQQKRKLIHPKRAKSNNSLMNIQDKHS